MKSFKNYEEYSTHSVTEKITLAHVEAKTRLYGFADEGDGVYSIITSHFVVGCQYRMDVLEALASPSEVASSGEGYYHFDIPSSKLYVYSAIGFADTADDPEVIPTFRFFFSNAPINLSWDLSDNGYEVCYESRLKSSPHFKSSIDNDQTGVSIAGSGTLKLLNEDFFFKDIYDLLMFENQSVSIYSYNRSLDPSQAKTIYRGAITEKAYGSSEVTFKVKDVISSLEAEIPLGKFSEITDEINISEEIGTYLKRRVYGFVSSLRCQSVDMLYDDVLGTEAYTLTGTVTGARDSNTLTGSNFLNELSPKDTITLGGGDYDVDSVISDTVVTLSDGLSKSVTDEEAKVAPTRTWYNSNRQFLICGHPLHNIETTITGVVERNRVYVDDPTHFKVGDYVDVGGQFVGIKRISGNKMIFRQNLATRPSIGMLVSKEKVQEVRVRYPNRDYRGITLIRGDYTVSETSDGSYLNLSDDAEKNATLTKVLAGNYYMVTEFDMMWLGKPSMFQINCVANVGGSLFGRYFTMRTDETEVMFYFSKVVEADQDETKKPEFAYSYTALASSNLINITGTTFAEGVQISFDETGIPAGLTPGHSYFTREVSGTSFRVSAEVDSSLKILTSNGGGSCSVEMETVEIALPNGDMTSSEVAVLVSKAISSELDAYLAKFKDETVTAYTKTGKNLLVGSSGNSGFSIVRLMAGKESDQSLSMPKLVNVRDLVKGYGTGDSAYQEILEVFDKSVRMRSSFIYDTGYYKVQAKNVGYVDNDSHIYVDTSGKLDSSGDLITKASYVVRDLLVEGGLESRLNEDSFDRASVNIPYDMSLRIPYDIADSAPEMRDVINDINQTVLGSLVIVDDLELAFNALDVERTTQDLRIISEDDIFSWSLKSKGSLYNHMIAKYRFTDLEESPSTEYLHSSEFASKYVANELTLSADFLLYNQPEAEEAAQRRLFYSTLLRGDITVKGSINLASHNMGDKVILSLRGLYNRTGNEESNTIIAVISSVTRNGESVTLVLTTQGANIFSKVAVITDDSRPDYDASTEEDKLYSSYIVGEAGTINNRTDLLNVNCIA